MKKYLFLSTLLAFGLAQFGAASTLVNFSAAGVQNTQVAGTTDFSFNNLQRGYSSAAVAVPGIGEFNGLAAENSGQFGGATGHSKYGVVGYPGNSNATLTFGGPASYVGFWWSAADAQNTVTLYSGKDAVLTLTGSDLVKSLGGCSSANAYCGNPVNGLDSKELFTYVNIFGQNGTKFSSISFQNGPETGFEFDNLAYIDPPDAPEPATWACLALGLGTLSLLGLRGRKA
ncbi:MAG TPA: hypothetical protein VLJ11_15365 [Bryobacteraceae bacterium]|nr:hypothetical protein [Bryobacteraceae bacterium]